MNATPVSTTAKALWFTSARRAELIEESVEPMKPDEVTVKAVVSLVSAGTEMLVYRGEIPAGDDLGSLYARGSFGFPIKYSYQVVGEVVAAGSETSFHPGELVFARHPHQELFNIRGRFPSLFKVPPNLAPERAAFANLLDVAVNCNLDVPVRHGDVVVVYGQGIVGSFCAQLAARTAGRIIVVDTIADRREKALAWGADAAVDPQDAAAAVEELSGGRGADISIEASGSPAALQSALRCTGQEGTIAAISFFGGKTVPLILNPEFHYRRQRIVSSQVSNVGFGLQPRWDRERRMKVCFDLLGEDWLKTFITQRMPFDQAPGAYELLDRSPEQALGVLLTYA
jgi:2-desacetyl-2-hydroxyethyl bacteriochlorophyllide A dehydrogenase